MLTTLALSAVAFAPPQAARSMHLLPHRVQLRHLQPVCQESGPSLVEQITDYVGDVGPNVFGTNEAVVESGIGAFLVPLRVAAGVLMIHHGSEGGIGPANFGTPGFDGFVDFIIKPYFGFLPGDPNLWSAIHDYIEFFGGVFFALGLLTRPSAFMLFFTMLAAVYFHLASTGLQGFPLGHVENYSYNFEEPALYALIFLLFLSTGSGPFSVDEKIAQSFDDEAVDL